jgi:hypothetical protein
MATRIEPFRDYSEHEVVNLFSLAVAADQDLSAWKAGLSDVNDAGVVVAASAGAKLPGELPSSNALITDGTTSLRKYLGASDQPHVGYNAYPIVEMTVTAAADKPIGLTLKQTLAYDENDENLLRYPLKADELQAVLPGQAVPILTRGLVLLNKLAFKDGNDGTEAEYPVAGDKLALGEAGCLKAAADGTLGTCLAVGEDKYLCKVSF